LSALRVRTVRQSEQVKQTGDPLIISREEIDRGVAALDEALKIADDEIED
jgi:4-aminobutyrate aminotransferase-like enzyme